MANPSGQVIPMSGLLRVVPPAALDAALQDEARKKAEAVKALPDEAMSSLAGYVRGLFDRFKRHRNDAKAGWSERLLVALRTFNGEYDATKLARIREFGGSEVYARIIAMKCRGATSLLRDVYLSSDRPWGIAPPSDPTIPPHILAAVQQLVTSEVNTAASAGQQVSVDAIRDRVLQLTEAARQAEKKQASKRAQIAEDKIDEILELGGFYRALAEFLVDLPLFPFAVIKGPVVRIVPQVTWASGAAQVEQKPRLFWQRTSPFDIWWTPGASDIEDADVIERSRVSRAELNDLLDLPGYNSDEIRAVLDEYGSGGLSDDWDVTDAERAVYEKRENPAMNYSGLINCLEFHGNVQGKLLLDYGLDKKLIPDPMRDYMVQLWLIGRHIIKCQLSPSPRKRHPYYVTSFEKVPGTPVGNGMPDLLNDIQDVCNAAMRALVNNLSIASGPQVVVNDDRLAPGENGDSLFPWKRWHTNSDPMGNTTQKPVDFFQPASNATELMAVYQKFSDIADELAAIPRYLNGQLPGGAGRTASGLAMLMGNASKILQTVAANVDRDVLSGVLTGLFDMLMLTDTSGVLQGDESVKVMGVNVAIQRETLRSRQLEFLQITANPLDSQIVGIKGRASVLRSVARTIGLDGEDIVPSEDELDAMEKQQQLQQQAQQQNPMQPAQAAAHAQGNQPGPSSTHDMGPRVRVAGGVG